MALLQYRNRGSRCIVVSFGWEATDQRRGLRTFPCGHRSCGGPNPVSARSCTGRPSLGPVVRRFAEARMSVRSPNLDYAGGHSNALHHPRRVLVRRCAMRGNGKLDATSKSIAECSLQDVSNTTLCSLMTILLPSRSLSLAVTASDMDAVSFNVRRKRASFAV